MSCSAWSTARVKAAASVEVRGGQPVMLAAAEGMLNQIELGSIVGGKFELICCAASSVRAVCMAPWQWMGALSRITIRGGTGQAVLQKRLDILALPRAGGCLPAWRILGGGAEGRQRGRNIDPLAAVVPMFDQGPHARQGPI